MIRPWRTSSPHSSSADGAVLTWAGSRVPAAEAVGAHAEVALRVDRVAAEGTAGPAGVQHLCRALDEGPRAPGVDAHEEHLVRLGLGELLVELVGADHRRLG